MFYTKLVKSKALLNTKLIQGIPLVQSDGGQFYVKNNSKIYDKFVSYDASIPGKPSLKI